MLEPDQSTATGASGFRLAHPWSRFGGYIKHSEIRVDFRRAIKVDYTSYKTNDVVLFHI